jgi:N-acetylmuramoyl-L-alanine amidase
MSELRICLDAGHGNKENFANNYYESEGNLEACLLLQKELEKYKNVKVFMTRTKHNENPSLAQRGQVAVKNNCQVFYSWHSDASSNPNTRGVTVIRSVKRPNSQFFGTLLAQAISLVMNAPLSPYVGNIGGVWTRLYPDTTNTDYYGVIREAVTSNVVEYAFLVEHSFHTNLQDIAYLDSAKNRQLIVEAEAKIFAQFFDLELKDEYKPTPPDLPDYHAMYIDASKELDKLRSEYLTLQEVKDALQRDFDSNMLGYTQDLGVKNAEIERLKKLLEETELERDLAGQELVGMEALKEELSAKIAELKSKIKELEQQIGMQGGKQNVKGHKDPER